jgi:hypothetical protein
VIVAEERKNKNNSPAIKEKEGKKAEEILRGHPPSSEGS